MIKVGDTVWVNEATLSGKPLKHEWYGKIISIRGERAEVKDTTGGTYHGEVFPRLLSNLELKGGDNPMTEHLSDGKKEEINEIQKLQFKIMELSSFNLFNGPEVVKDLKENRDLWVGCIWGKFEYSVLMPLRDINMGYWNTDTLYILTSEDKVKRLKELARKWKADEFGVVYRDREEGIVDFKHNETRKWFGANLIGDECLIRIWWD